MSEESLAFNHHVRGITTATFHSTPALYDLYTVLSTNKDKNGIEFVSSIEGIAEWNWNSWVTETE